MIKKSIEIYSRAEFREWLKENHQKEKQVVVILYKRHTGKTAPTHREQIEEAICFGWIDTTIKRIDEDRYMRNFVCRNKNSKWSKNTLGYAKELMQAELMAPEGIKYYKLGLAKPTHDDGIPKNPDMPENLKKALAESKEAEKCFSAFPPSAKKMIFRWLLSAKRSETKEKRIQMILKKAKRGERVF